MLHVLNATHSALDRFSEWTGRCIAWLTLVMVLVTFAIVVLRYAFNTGWIAMQESVLYLHSFVFMLGGAYTLKHNGHVRVDIVYRSLGPRGQAWVDLLGTLLLLMPVCGFILWSSWDYVWDAWALREGSREAGGLPWVYVLKTTLLLMPLLLILQGIAEIMRNLLVIRGARLHARPYGHEADTL